MRTADFDYELPPELIAQTPLPQRDQSRLLVFHRSTGRIEHRRFPDLLEYLAPGDVLVLNDSRVIPARLRGFKPGTGGQFEILLLEENGPNDWWVMVRPGKRMRRGTALRFHSLSGAPTPLEAVVAEKNAEGHCRLQFSGVGNVRDVLEAVGEMPLPPYINRPAGASQRADRERYQTVYAAADGSVAAPTAGLHFTPALLERVRVVGVPVCRVTLHVGLGTFAPVKEARLEDHPMHTERFQIEPEAARQIAETRRRGGRVIAVGTTIVRVLESVAAQNHGRIVATNSSTRLFVYPPYAFQATDMMLTNFHLPKSTLLMLVSAFASTGTEAGRERILRCYAEAIRLRYRFFSYGDAMLLV